MKYEVDKQERYTVMSLKDANVNSLVAPDLKSEFVVLSNEGITNLIVDLSGVEYIDSSGLSAILTANRVFKANQGTMVVTGIKHPAVKKLFEISRLDTVINVVPTLEESVDFILMDEVERELTSEEDADS